MPTNNLSLNRMDRKTVAFLLLVLGLCVTGCKTPPVVAEPPLPQPFGYTHYFSDNPQRLLFKTRLQLAKEEFSGLLLVKQTASTEYRAVFTTETGFKVFDLTVRNDGYVMNYGVGPIEKKFIAVRLAYTVQAMLLRDLPGSPGVVPDPQAPSALYMAGKYAYDLQQKNGRIVTQWVLFKNKRKAEAQFSDFGDDNVPDSVTVTHFGFPLNAGFKFLKQ